ncbi:iron complex transport system permease protein [Herbihabitans rhizosphaerae]|uniref:Iron complex transport system permease protein n=1 Tax=Herbihabitans rhizosphaerae TaxID=1872711 RepID=A0A4V2ES94_9PSEU|nr:iron ABC transporter permease [Herbihabitans rhizosphaerae]RZS36783.1 iron complex transport system permease protein [Herbihabitans rhizosphaerae]
MAAFLPRRVAPLAGVLLGALAVSVLCGVALGPVSVPLGDVLRYLRAAITSGVIDNTEAGTYHIVWEIRLPRVLLAAVVGAGLSVVGVVVQTMVRNALADPFVLGLSSGASVGAASVVVFGAFASLGLFAISAAASLGALAAMALVYLAARTAAGLTPLRLVLTGSAMGYAFAAVTTVVIFLAPHGEAARAVLFWLLGGLGAATWTALPLASIVVLAGLAYLRLIARSLNALSTGDETARTLGVDPDVLRRRLFVVSSVLTGALVAVSGAVGFVGLVVPHLVRMVVGADHRRVLTVAPLAGAVFLIWADLAARTIVAPQELPLGVITAAVGVPCFVFLMRSRAYVFGGR